MLERPILYVGDQVAVQQQLLHVSKLREGQAADLDQTIMGQVSGK